MSNDHFPSLCSCIVTLPRRQRLGKCMYLPVVVPVTEWWAEQKFSGDLQTKQSLRYKLEILRALLEAHIFHVFRGHWWVHFSGKQLDSVEGNGQGSSTGQWAWKDEYTLTRNEAHFHRFIREVDNQHSFAITVTNLFEMSHSNCQSNPSCSPKKHLTAYHLSGCLATP